MSEHYDRLLSFPVTFEHYTNARWKMSADKHVELCADDLIILSEY